MQKYALSLSYSFFTTASLTLGKLRFYLCTKVAVLELDLLQREEENLTFPRPVYFGFTAFAQRFCLKGGGVMA